MPAPSMCRLPSIIQRIGTAVTTEWVKGAGGMLALMLLAGCQSGPKVTIDWQGGPFFTPTNFVGLAEMPAELRRVAVLPLSGIEGLPPDAADALQAAALAALLGTGRFEAVAVDPMLVRAAAGKPAVSSVETMPEALIERIVREHAPDAVLFIDVTAYRPYPPLALGVRVKLAGCQKGRPILWAFDTIYDARNLAVANSARRHVSGGHSGLVDPGPAALQSPSRFAAYVFSDTFALLPKRPEPVPAKVSRARAD